MATLYSSLFDSSGVKKLQPRWKSGDVITVTGQYTYSSALANGDIIQMVPVPKDAKIVNWILSTTDADTNGTPTVTYDLGDGGDQDRFAAGLTTGQTGGNAVASSGRTVTTSSGVINVGLGYKYTEDDTIDIVIAAGPATGATSGTIVLSVTYFCGEW